MAFQLKPYNNVGKSFHQVEAVRGLFHVLLVQLLSGFFVNELTNPNFTLAYLYDIFGAGGVQKGVNIGARVEFEVIDDLLDLFGLILHLV